MKLAIAAAAIGLLLAAFVVWLLELVERWYDARRKRRARRYWR
jgi:hypothetical protein